MYTYGPMDYQGVRWTAVSGMYPGDMVGNYLDYFMFIALVIMLIKLFTGI